MSTETIFIQARYWLSVKQTFGFDSDMKISAFSKK